MRLHVLAIAVCLVASAPSNRPVGTLLPDSILTYRAGSEDFSEADFELTTQEYSYIRSQLQDPYRLESLLLEDTIAFDIDHLSVPEGEVRRLIFEDVRINKKQTNYAFGNLVFSRTELPTPEIARARVESFIDGLAAKPDFVNLHLKGIQTLFDSSPNLRATIYILITHLGGEFNDNLVKLTSFLFSIANQRNPKVSMQLQNLFDRVEAKYNFIPKDLFSRIQETYQTAVYYQ